MFKQAVKKDDCTFLIESNENDIQLEFHIYSDNQIDFQKLTQITQLAPTITYNKGDLIRIGLYRQEYVWGYHTNHIKSFDIEPALIEIMDKINNPETIAKYCKKNGYDIKITIIIREIVDVLAGIHFSKEFIQYCSILGARVDTDILL
ncbi:MAG: DUF4279 domain-containing protein [Paludibacteraceae bacterium]|nr:DUF4279 domain-containing protein [Paludibacteraceae bacterium]